MHKQARDLVTGVWSQIASRAYDMPFGRVLVYEEASETRRTVCCTSLAGTTKGRVLPAICAALEARPASVAFHFDGAAGDDFAAFREELRGNGFRRSRQLVWLSLQDRAAVFSGRAVSRDVGKISVAMPHAFMKAVRNIPAKRLIDAIMEGRTENGEIGWFVMKDPAGELAGCGAYDARGGLGYLHDLYVRGNLRRSGRGREILRALVEDLEAHGVRQAIALQDKDNAVSGTVLARLGFRPCAASEVWRYRYR